MDSLRPKDVVQLIREMQRAYARGKNAMEAAKNYLQVIGCYAQNTGLQISVAYDLQAGSYIDINNADLDKATRWWNALGRVICPFIAEGDVIVEAGIGDGTSLNAVLDRLRLSSFRAYGFDISYSRVTHARRYLKMNGNEAELVVGDISKMPLADCSVDVLYTVHALEPNGGNEDTIISECLRVSRKYTILIEPLFEFADNSVQSEMQRKGYVKGLKEAAERCGAEVLDFKLLDYIPDLQNPSGVLLLKKALPQKAGSTRRASPWVCPLSHEDLLRGPSSLITGETGLMYPVISNIPVLLPTHFLPASNSIFE